MSGRLFKAAGASGEQAESAIQALPENRQASRSTAPASVGNSVLPSIIDAVEVAIAEPVAAAALSPLDSLPSQSSLTEFEHLFASTPAAPADGATPATVNVTASSAAAPAPFAVSSAVPAESDEEWEEVVIRQFPWMQTTLILLAVGLVFGFASALLFNTMGIWLGIPMFVATVLLALRAYINDRWAPAVMSPIAWLVAILIPGQFTVSHDGSLFLTVAVLVFQSLSDVAIWLVGGVIAASVIATVRGRRELA